MRKVIAAINMTLDGYCNHEAVIPDEELHQYFNDLLSEVDTLIFGRTTYQLMEESWPLIVKNPTGIKAMDEFAVLIDAVSKIVFSHTLKNVKWRNSRLATGDLKEEVLKLKQQAGKSISVGSPGLIAALTRDRLIDEYRLSVQPIILGKGLTLFKNITDKINLKLIKTKNLGSGVVILTYEPV